MCNFGIADVFEGLSLQGIGGHISPRSWSTHPQKDHCV